MSFVKNDQTSILPPSWTFSRYSGYIKILSSNSNLRFNSRKENSYGFNVSSRNLIKRNQDFLSAFS